MKIQWFKIGGGACVCVLLSCCAGGGGDPDALAAKVRQFSIADLRPAKVDVVEVREKDLKALPTGEERALAYQRSGRRFSWLSGPVDFEEPDLPTVGLPVDGMLLPSLD